jgi:hypothetical protein
LCSRTTAVAKYININNHCFISLLFTTLFDTSSTNDPRWQYIWIFSSSQMGCLHDNTLCTFILYTRLSIGKSGLLL